LHFSSSRPGYYRALREYYRGLAARNRLLKNDAPGDQIRAHDRPLAEAAAAVRRHRREGTDALVPVFAESFDRISGGLDGPALSLRASLPDPDPGEIRRSWEAGLERDRALRSTQAGPHRDDWIFATETGDAREYASDGQQRNLAIALKLALFRDLRASAAEEPVLLADDILGELDPVRRRAFWDGLPADCQVIATGTEFDPSRHPGRWEAYTVEGGTFEKRHDS
jgi:DNA replication and repair protein RecF